MTKVERKFSTISLNLVQSFPKLFSTEIFKQQFLANTHNKSRFISMLCEKFTTANISVKQADNDADVLIIETTIKQFSRINTTIVVGEDVDLLILTHCTNSK